MRRTYFVLLLGAALFFARPSVISAQSSAQQNKMSQNSVTRPMHDSHASMNERGEIGMGFSQTQTVHHFFLTESGGAIQVETKRADNKVDRSAIRRHLAHIAQAFSEGDFAIPMFIHDTVPPGVPEMKRLRKRINYSFQTTPSGGRVIISTTDEKAVAAIHQFLRFQIRAHDTGDSTAVRERLP